MRHSLISSINTLFSSQSHCINRAGINLFHFSLMGQQCPAVVNAGVIEVA